MRNFKITPFVLLLGAVSLAAGSAYADDFHAFDVERNGKKIGEATVSRFSVKGSTCVDYRIRVDVTELGFSMFKLRRHQLARFDKRGGILAAEAHNVQDQEARIVSLSSNGTKILIDVDGKTTLTDRWSIAGTTLSFLTGAAVKSGTWFDLNKGALEKYLVKTDGPVTKLERSGGTETIQFGDDRFLERLETTDSSGTVILKRAPGAADRRLPFEAEKDIPECAFKTRT